MKGKHLDWEIPSAIAQRQLCHLARLLVVEVRIVSRDLTLLVEVDVKDNTMTGFAHVKNCKQRTDNIADASPESFAGSSLTLQH